MNNRKIKAFLLIACIINLTITNFIPVYATVPGVVEAESIWLTLETIALNMGVTLEFMPDKSISYNNEQKRQEIVNYIDQELADGVISQSQHDAAIANLDNLTGVNGSHVGVGDVIDIGADLWSSLSRLYYNNYIKQDINLVQYLSSSAKAKFNSMSGRCCIYGIISPSPSNVPSDTKYIILFGNTVLSNPIYSGHNPNGWTDWQLNDPYGDITYFYDNYYGGTYTIYQNYVYAHCIGDNIITQYIDNKTVDEDFTVNDGENALTTAPTYQDYLDKLADIYELLDGKIVVKDTGDVPTVLDGDTIADTVADIQDGVTSWEDAIPTIQAAEGDTTGDIVGENSVIGKKALDELVTGLNVSQIQNKFPFCIPNDLKQIATGAANVSGNAPVIVVPMKLEFAGHTYYDNDEAVVIDLAEFSQLAIIFRKGFLLLFLIGIIYLSIYVVSSFFHITE